MPLLLADERRHKHPLLPYRLAPSRHPLRQVAPLLRLAAYLYILLHGAVQQQEVAVQLQPRVSDFQVKCIAEKFRVHLAYHVAVGVILDIAVECVLGPGAVGYAVVVTLPEYGRAFLRGYMYAQIGPESRAAGPGTCFQIRP